MTVVDILLAPLAFLFYAGGLLLWPIRRWRRRLQPIRGKALYFVFLSQLGAYVIVAFLAVVRPQIMEHGYYWFILCIEINIVFTIVGAIAWSRDSRFERRIAIARTS